MDLPNLSSLNGMVVSMNIGRVSGQTPYVQQSGPIEVNQTLTEFQRATGMDIGGRPIHDSVEIKGTSEARSAQDALKEYAKTHGGLVNSYGQGPTINYVQTPTPPANQPDIPDTNRVTPTRETGSILEYKHREEPSLATAESKPSSHPTSRPDKPLSASPSTTGTGVKLAGTASIVGGVATAFQGAKEAVNGKLGEGAVDVVLGGGNAVAGVASAMGKRMAGPLGVGLSLADGSRDIYNGVRENNTEKKILGGVKVGTGVASGAALGLGALAATGATVGLATLAAPAALVLGGIGLMGAAGVAIYENRQALGSLFGLGK